MELVGRAVKKRFPGFGTFSGFVESYDPDAGYFRVLYEDGDSEELEFQEIASMLMEMGEDASPPEFQVWRGKGRPPKKHRPSEMEFAACEDVDLGSGRVVDSGFIGEDGKLDEPNGNLAGIGEEYINSECNRSCSPLMENCFPKTTEEIFRNGDGVMEGISSNGCSERFAGTPIIMNLKADIGRAEEYGLGVGRFSEHAKENSVGKGDEVTEVEVYEFENCEIYDVSTQTQGCDHENLETKQNDTKKRRRLSGKVYCPQDVPLRRSARRVVATAVSQPYPSHSYMSKSESRFQNCNENDFDNAPEDSKPELPPSSSDLDFHGLPVIDLFSIYTFLRSFSRVLFLSPFSLEMFVSSLRCNFANPLIDHIHFSILQTLKQHLELLSEEGSQLAADCLRSLNWDLLDLVTWPVYLAGYLLIHGSKIKSSAKMAHSNVSTAEYYTLEATTKLEMLHFLCDSVVEAEGMRSELDIRMNECAVTSNAHNNIDRSRNDLTITSADGPLAPEVTEETADGNSDECCLCGMDGSLICCDGCPAAFHSRCVGVVKDLLPEGDWYCPECLLEKHDGLTKLSKSSQGAEVLSTDPHGRVYFSCCGYLLVTDSCDYVSSSVFYNKDDLDSVIRVLKSYHSYSIILNAISAHWGNSLDSCDSVSRLCSGTSKRNMSLDTELPSKDLSSSFQNVANTNNVEKNSKDNCSTDHSGLNNTTISDLSQTHLLSLDHVTGSSHPFTSSQAEEQLIYMANHSQFTQQAIADCSLDPNYTVNEALRVKSSVMNVENRRCLSIGDQNIYSFVTEQRKAGPCQLESDPGGYINYYIFGRVASSVAKDLSCKSTESNNKEIKKSDDDLVLLQLKAISKRYLTYSYYNFLKLSDVQKEKCGWCHSCKTSTNNDCVFVVNDRHLVISKEHTVHLQNEKKSHICSAIDDILSIEFRLNGLLSGMWENPQYSRSWRKAVMETSNVVSLRHMLLIVSNDPDLESNLRRVAMLSDWTKPVDSAQTLGSSSHIFMGSMDVPSNTGGSRKHGKKANSGAELTISQADAPSYTPSHICWWRGGRLSRQVFHWKILPQSLTSKGGRQGGCKKISHVFYPDGSEFARRSKFVVWRAAVEMSKTVAHLTFLIKELDSNIRWLELLKSPPFPQLAKESKSLARLFKKVIIRRKAMDVTNVKYLLDFGKRENLPPTVTRNGILHKDPSSERKKFWLSENHVPLYLIKDFELKKLARSMKKTGAKLPSVKVGDFSAKRLERSGNLSYLLSRAEILEGKICGYCNKNVLMREAIKCQLCDGYFHKKHVRVSKGAIPVEYICYRCKDKKSMKANVKKRKIVSREKEKGSGSDSKVLPKKRRRVLVKTKKKPKLKKKQKLVVIRQANSRIVNISNPRKRKRTTMHYSFWLNGLQWARKSVVERAKNFRKANVMLPSQRLFRSSKRPVCCLCLKEYDSELIYVCCDNCKDWFHGDVYGLALEEINNLIGFKCHKCRKRSIPVCPFSSHTGNEISPSREFTMLEVVANVEQDMKERLNSEKSENSSVSDGKDCLDLQNDGSSCVILEVPIAYESECPGRNILDYPFSNLPVNEFQLSGQLKIIATTTYVEQDHGDRLHNETFDSSSPAVHNEEHLDEENNCSASTPARAEDAFTLETTCKDLCSSSTLTVDEIQFCGEFTLTETDNNMGGNSEKKLQSETLEHCSQLVCSENYLDQNKNDSTFGRDEASYTPRTEPENGPCTHPMEGKAVSCKIDNDLHIVMTSQEMESSNEMVIVKELLVSDPLDHPESQKVLSGKEVRVTNAKS
ncbi:hypothetical protein ZIOFF_013066 [Zingiber officinale]|uniref:DDT domain-containing protein PTM n=1 Tax=Zingiber officinale TaxID=94328 RepID=A0A8J5LCA6_ZINOF|nr:hypothetical protein ZIOFF_013066 [Zingiber officinale]